MAISDSSPFASFGNRWDDTPYVKLAMSTLGIEEEFCDLTTTEQRIILELAQHLKEHYRLAESQQWQS